MTITITADELDAATIDVVFALRDSINDAEVSYLDFWAGRCATAIDTAAAGSDSFPQAVTTMCRKLQIGALTPGAAKEIARVSAVIDPVYEQWAEHIARNLIYIIALANTQRDARKNKGAKK